MGQAGNVRIDAPIEQDFRLAHILPKGHTLSQSNLRALRVNLCHRYSWFPFFCAFVVSLRGLCVLRGETLYPSCQFVKIRGSLSSCLCAFVVKKLCARSLPAFYPPQADWRSLPAAPLGGCVEEPAPAPLLDVGRSMFAVGRSGSPALLPPCSTLCSLPRAKS